MVKGIWLAGLQLHCAVSSTVVSLQHILHYSPALILLRVEHLGLIPPQLCDGRNQQVDSFMRPAPYPNEDETRLAEDDAVADPLASQTESLLNDTARKNREIFTEIFRPVPTNLIRSWDGYAVCLPHDKTLCDFLLIKAQNYVPKTKTDHVVPDIPLSRVKDRLSQVRGALVECPLVSRVAIFLHWLGLIEYLQDFLIDQKDFVDNPQWSGLDPTLPIYI